MDCTPSVQFILPDFLAMCPLNGATNPHYEDAVAEVRAWISSYNVFSGRKRTFFFLTSIERLACRVYADAGPEEFKTCCYFVNLLFSFDEFSDDQTGKGAQSTGNTFLNAMKDPDWDDHSAFSQITKTFRARFLPRVSRNVTARFLRNWEKYCASVVTEAELRERGEILGVNSFVSLRRENSAVALCFDLIEYCYGLDLPNEVFENSTFMEIYYAALDLVCWTNDVYSYDMEQSKGINGNNIVTVLMKEGHIDLQAAVDYAGTYCQELMNRFISAQARLPS